MYLLTVCQGELAAHNIGRMISGDIKQLDSYFPPPYGIKVTLGLDSGITQENGKCKYQSSEDCSIDLATPSMWALLGVSTHDMTV